MAVYHRQSVCWIIKCEFCTSALPIVGFVLADPNTKGPVVSPLWCLAGTISSVLSAKGGT